MATLQTPEKVTAAATSPKELEALARSVYDYFNAREIAKVAAMVADDCEWLDVSTGVIFKGPDGYVDFDNGWLTAFPDGRIEVKKMVCQGDIVATEFVARGTHHGPLVGPEGTIEATGKKVELACVEFLQFREKKIVRARFYMDLMTLLRQIGVAK